MKLCNSPANTYCTYQRIARDQAPTDEPDNGAQAGAASQAYESLYQHLEGNNDTEALGLLKHLMNCMSDGGAAAMDQPPPFTGRPTASALDSELRRRVAIGWQTGAAKLAKRFPGTSRIRNIG